MGWFGLTPRARDRVALALLGGIAFAATLYLLAPGWMAQDSGAQLAQARSLKLSDDHPPLMALIWHVTDGVLPGPLGMLVLMSALYWTGLTAIFATLDGPLALRLLALLVVGAYPPAAANLPGIWKDNLMHGALLFGVACFVVAAGGRRWRRWAGAALGVLAFLVAIGARHNGAAAVWPFLILLWLELPLLERRAPLVRWLAAAGASLVCTLALTIGLGKALAPLTQKTEFWQIVPVFDLAGMSLAAGEVLVEPETGVLTRGMGLREIGFKYNPRYVNSLYYCLPFKGKRCVPVFKRTVDAGQLERLRANWLRAIVQHPGAYLKHRWHVADRLLGDGAPALYFVDRAPHTEAALDYPPPRRTERLLSWVDAQFGSLWFLPLVYVALSIVLLPVAIWRHARGAPALPIVVLLSGLSYIASCVLSAGASDFRYTIYTISCSVLASGVLLVSFAQAFAPRWSAALAAVFRRGSSREVGPGVPSRRSV
ncbi:MAG TPA: hypothetical protein VMG12_04290 [Polyangiaceae bacterium]|nr:hypothetical protein [Polyangiaceae bacterium]